MDGQSLTSILQWIHVWVGAQKHIQIFHPAKIRTDRNVLDRAPVLIRAFSFIPRTAILLPCDTPLRTRQVNIHVRTFEFLDFLDHRLYSHQPIEIFPLREHPLQHVLDHPIPI